VICNTSPLQYLHQLGLLPILPALVRRVIVPQAVTLELAAGRTQGIDLPRPETLAWVTIRQPSSATVLPLITDLGLGEKEALALALESSDAVVILDDALARRVAMTLGIQIRGTLGVLLDAKQAGLIPAIAPLLDTLILRKIWGVANIVTLSVLIRT